MDPVVIAGLVSSLLTTIFGSIGLWVYRILKMRAEQSRQDKQDEKDQEREDHDRSIEELYRLVTMLRAEVDQVKQELKAEKAAHRATADEHSQCRERIARLEAWYQATTGKELPKIPEHTSRGKMTHHDG